MVTSIPTTADLLRLLREDPDFRDEVRRLVLSQELLELPERFARFESYVERQFSEVRGDITRIDGSITEMRSDITEMRGDITEMRGDITEMRGDITEMRGDITEMRGDITEMRGDLGRLKGADYERHVSGNFASHASIAFNRRHGRSLRRNSLLLSKVQGVRIDFEELLSNAVDNGLISDEELSELRQVDAVMSGQDGSDTVYFVGEISLTVNNSDIDRAIVRAAILGKATGSNAWPMVIGDTIPDPQRARAQAEAVAFRQVAD